MTRVARIVYYFLVLLNVLELLSGTGQAIMARYPAAKITASEESVAYFLITNSLIMLTGLYLVRRGLGSAMRKDAPSAPATDVSANR